MLLHNTWLEAGAPMRAAAAPLVGAASSACAAGAPTRSEPTGSASQLPVRGFEHGSRACVSPMQVLAAPDGHCGRTSRHEAQRHGHFGRFKFSESRRGQSYRSRSRPPVPDSPAHCYQSEHKRKPSPEHHSSISDSHSASFTPYEIRRQGRRSQTHDLPSGGAPCERQRRTISPPTRGRNNLLFCLCHISLARGQEELQGQTSQVKDLPGAIGEGAEESQVPA